MNLNKKKFEASEMTKLFFKCFKINILLLFTAIHLDPDKIIKIYTIEGLS